MSGVTLTELRTPAVLVERPRAVTNMRRMQQLASDAGMALRPHAKTHKSPELARWQLEAGAIGICCAKLGEAEVFADAGLTDIRLPYPLQPSNADRVLALQQKARVSFIVDSLDVARGWSEAMTASGARAEVLAKIDVGFHRCGIAPDPVIAVPFLAAVAALPGLRLAGILSHAGHAYHAHSEDELRMMAKAEVATMAALAHEARAAGLAIDEVSAGTTPNARHAMPAGRDTYSEFRPGNYVYFDRTMVGLGAASWDDCALSVLATVVSVPAADRVVLDCGSKTLAADGARGFAGTTGHGAVFREVAATPGQSPDAHLIVERLSEEHATVRVTAGARPLRPGDRVRVVPNHACVVSNLVDTVWLVDGDDVADMLAVAARGRIQ